MSGPGGPGDFDPHRDDLETLRRQIDHLDRQIAGALALRAQIAEMAAERRDGADPGRDPDREREVVERVRDVLETNGVGGRYDVDGIYERVFAATRGQADEDSGGGRRLRKVRTEGGSIDHLAREHKDGVAEVTLCGRTVYELGDPPNPDATERLCVDCLQEVEEMPRSLPGGRS